MLRMRSTSSTISKFRTRLTKALRASLESTSLLMTRTRFWLFRILVSVWARKIWTTTSVQSPAQEQRLSSKKLRKIRMPENLTLSVSSVSVSTLLSWLQKESMFTHERQPATKSINGQATVQTATQSKKSKQTATRLKNMALIRLRLVVLQSKCSWTMIQKSTLHDGRLKSLSNATVTTLHSRFTFTTHRTNMTTKETSLEARTRLTR